MFPNNFTISTNESMGNTKEFSHQVECLSAMDKIRFILGVRTCNTHQLRKRKKTKKST